MIALGAVFILWPDWVRKYETRLALVVGDRGPYLVIIRLFGGLLVIAGIASIVSLLASVMK